MTWGRVFLKVLESDSNGAERITLSSGGFFIGLKFCWVGRRLNRSAWCVLVMIGWILTRQHSSCGHADRFWHHSVGGSYTPGAAQSSSPGLNGVAIEQPKNNWSSQNSNSVVTKTEFNAKGESRKLLVLKIDRKIGWVKTIKDNQQHKKHKQT